MIQSNFSILVGFQVFAHNSIQIDRVSDVFWLNKVIEHGSTALSKNFMVKVTI